MPLYDTQTTPLIRQLIVAELTPTRSQMHEQYSPEYIADAMIDSIGEDVLNRATDAQRKQLQADFIARFDFYKVTIAIPDDLLDRCFGPKALAPLAARGEAVKLYGEPAVLEAAKRCGYASLTALAPIRGPNNSDKNSSVSNASTNPWSPKMGFAKPEQRREAQLAIIGRSTSLAAKLAAAAGRTIADTPLFNGRK